MELEYYASIGSRETPRDVLQLMKRIAAELYSRGYVLRSGAAPGADTAFEHGHNAACRAANGPIRKEIFLPDRWFNDSSSELHTPSKGAYDIAQSLHPNWKACSAFAKKLHARNTHQILGQDLLTPVSFVVCWTPPDGRRSGTDQALRVARAWPEPIGIFNLNNMKWRPTELFLHNLGLTP